MMRTSPSPIFVTAAIYYIIVADKRHCELALRMANDINLKPNHRVALLEILENLLLCLENT
jgi:hypothetical protein